MYGTAAKSAFLFPLSHWKAQERWRRQSGLPHQTGAEFQHLSLRLNLEAIFKQVLNKFCKGKNVFPFY